MKIGRVTATGAADQELSDGHLKLPMGTNVDRPSEPVEGMLRYNSSTGGIEGYSRGWWSNLLTTSEFQVPGVELDEDENVTIASLAILLSQFQRTVTGGVDMVGTSLSHDPADGAVASLPSPLDSNFYYLSGSSPARGTIDGWKDTAGKGETYLAVTGDKVTRTTGPAWNIGGSYTAQMAGETFQLVIDPYLQTGFPEEERHNYLIDYFTCIYNADWRATGYTVVGGDAYLTPVWNLQDPYSDPDYGKLLLTMNLRNAANVLSKPDKQAQKNSMFIKWYTKFVKFRNFQLKSSPGFTPGGGSSPMPVNPTTGIATPDTISIKSDTKRLIVKDYLMRKYPTWDSKSPVNVTVHVEPDIAIYNDVNSEPAIDGRSLPSGSTLLIKNEGYIIGGGGVGGRGEGWYVDRASGSIVYQPAQAGGSGGIAVALDSNITTVIDNGGGTIAGGGGGGGGGAARNIFGGGQIFAAGSGGGSGGALNLNVSEKTFGQGKEYTTVGGTPTLTHRAWDGTGGTTGAIRTGSGALATAGGSAGIPGVFIETTLTGGTGGEGGSIGVVGSDGETIAETPNVSIIGWTINPGGGPRIVAGDWIEVDGTRITFVDTAPADATEYQIDGTDSTNNNINWLNGLISSGVLDSTKYDIYTFDDASGTGIGKILDPTGGAYVWKQLVLGMMFISKTSGAAAETWVNDINSQGSSCTNIQPAGGSAIARAGGAGGAPGAAINGGVLQYGSVDIAADPPTYAVDASKNGTIIGTVS